MSLKNVQILSVNDLKKFVEVVRVVKGVAKVLVVVLAK